MFLQGELDPVIDPTNNRIFNNSVGGAEVSHTTCFHTGGNCIFVRKAFYANIPNLV